MLRTYAKIDLDIMDFHKNQHMVVLTRAEKCT